MNITRESLLNLFGGLITVTFLYLLSWTEYASTGKLFGPIQIASGLVGIFVVPSILLDKPGGCE